MFRLVPFPLFNNSGSYFWFVPPFQNFWISFRFWLKIVSKTEIPNHLPSLLYIEMSWEFSQILLKERFSRDLSDKIKKNIESHAKNEGFGWLKHVILRFAQGSLCFSFGRFWLARAAFSAAFQRGRNFGALPLF